jgi:hypoxanthine phosphoribosyltransferase
VARLGARPGADVLAAPVPDAPAGPEAVFAHPAERQFAAVLDFYGVAWEYEPRTFVLVERDDGCPTLAFTPDFYLPEFDIYVELTTLDQRLVTRKNRKLRLLRERYPDVEVRILYRRDYQALSARFGFEPLPAASRRGPAVA